MDPLSGIALGLGGVSGIAGMLGSRKQKRAGEKWEKENRIRNEELRKLALIQSRENSAGGGLSGDIADRRLHHINREFDIRRKGIERESPGMMNSNWDQIQSLLGLGSTAAAGLGELGVFDSGGGQMGQVGQAAQGVQQSMNPAAKSYFRSIF